MRYIVTRARAPGATSNERHLEEVLRDCPSNYRLHSVVPVASGFLAGCPDPNCDGSLMLDK